MNAFSQEQQYESALRLHGILNGLFGRAFGYFMGGKLDLCSNLHIAGHPEKTIETRDELKELMEGLSLLYLFALWDEHIQNDFLQLNIGNDELSKLRAFKHVRHTVAHGTTGKRARQNRKEFDAAFPFAGISLDVRLDVLSIRNSSVALECHKHMAFVSGKLAAKLYQTGFNPTP